MQTFVHGEDLGRVGHAYGLGLERYSVNGLTVLGHMGTASAHGAFHGAESVYGVDNPRLNYSAVAADLGARWFLRSLLHVTVHGGYTLYRRFEFTQGRDPVPGGEYELANGLMFGVDLGIGG